MSVHTVSLKWLNESVAASDPPQPTANSEGENKPSPAEGELPAADTSSGTVIIIVGVLVLALLIAAYFISKQNTA